MRVVAEFYYLWQSCGRVCGRLFPITMRVVAEVADFFYLNVTFQKKKFEKNFENFLNIWLQLCQLCHNIDEY
jgi:hypothetical protein